MKKMLLFSMTLLMVTSGFSQSDIEYYEDGNEIRLAFETAKSPDPIRQQEIRENGPWNAFKSAHSGWYALMSEEHGLPQRAWGTPLDVMGASSMEKAEWFIANELSRFGIKSELLSAPLLGISKKHDRVRYF
ncbi:MAG: hypothetical protein ACI8TS_001982, partial [Flavobacteriales bacterium]